MAKKPAPPKFYATYRYVAMLRVPLAATTMNEAAVEAQSLHAGNVQENYQDIHDHEVELQAVEKDGVWL